MRPDEPCLIRTRGGPPSGVTVIGNATVVEARLERQEGRMAVVVIGLVSDTHGMFRGEVTAALSGVSMILHAGDVGGERVLRELRAIAPVQAVRGNVDDPADPGLEQSVSLQAGGLSIHVSHGHELGSPTPERLLLAYGADIIVFGHTHRATIERAGRRLVVNPGAAGARRFNLKPSVARLTIVDGDPAAEIIWLP